MNQDISYENPVTLEVKNSQLSINYESVNGSAIYDLCSLEGRILVTGKLDSSPKNTLDLSGYPKGMYNLFILDGDRVFKNAFRL